MNACTRNFVANNVLHACSGAHAGQGLVHVCKHCGARAAVVPNETPFMWAGPVCEPKLVESPR